MSIKHRFDFKQVIVRLSTWLALMATSATGVLAAYALTPDRAQNLVPDWVLQTCAGIALGSAALIPIATSFKQRNLGRARCLGPVCGVSFRRQSLRKPDSGD